MANYTATGAAEQPEAELQASALKTQHSFHLMIGEGGRPDIHDTADNIDVCMLVL